MRLKGVWFQIVKRLNLKWFLSRLFASRASCVTRRTSGVVDLWTSLWWSGATMTIKFTGVTLESTSLGLPPFKLPSPLDVLPEARGFG